MKVISDQMLDTPYVLRMRNRVQETYVELTIPRRVKALMDPRSSFKLAISSYET